LWLDSEDDSSTFCQGFRMHGALPHTVPELHGAVFSDEDNPWKKEQAQVEELVFCY
jgi:hypothetical protein